MQTSLLKYKFYLLIIIHLMTNGIAKYPIFAIYRNSMHYLYVMEQNDFIKGTLSTILLQLLSEKGPMYGYELSREVKERSSGAIQLREGSLYPALRKMLAEGVLVARTETVGNRARVYYSVTEQGKLRAKEQSSELLRFMNTIRELLLPQPGASYG